MNKIILSIMIPVYNQEKLILCALESIPKRDDIELIIIDDHSIDHTWPNILGWINSNKDKFGNILLERNKENKGCGFSKNWAYTQAQGKFIITLDSDDYLYTKEYNDVIDNLYNLSADMIYIANKINSGEIWSRNDRKATWSYFVRNEFLKLSGLNYDIEARRAGDFELTKSLQMLPHEEIILKNVCYHYNFPREGSIVWNYEHGVD